MATMVIHWKDKDIPNMEIKDATYKGGDSSIIKISSGNKVTLLADGQAAYAAMFEAIQDARDHINLESYIIEDDETGRKFADLLLQKQAEGVQVNLIYDSVGSMNAPAPFFQRLRDGGIQVVEFNPVNPLKAREKCGLTHRDHGRGPAGHIHAELLL